MSTEPRGLTEQPTAIGTPGHDRRTDGHGIGPRRRPAHWSPGTSIAMVGLIGFVGLTLFIAAHGVVPFDVPLLDRARAYSAYDDLWNLLSNAANLPLIAIGVGLVVWLFVKHGNAARPSSSSSSSPRSPPGARRSSSSSPARGRRAATRSSRAWSTAIRPATSWRPSTIFGIIAILLWRSSQPLWLRAGFAIAVAAVRGCAGRRSRRHRRPLPERRAGRVPGRHRRPRALRCPDVGPGPRERDRRIGLALRAESGDRRRSPASKVAVRLVHGCSTSVPESRSPERGASGDRASYPAASARAGPRIVRDGATRRTIRRDARPRPPAFDGRAPGRHRRVPDRRRPSTSGPSCRASASATGRKRR